MEDLRLFGNMLEKLILDKGIMLYDLCEKLDCTKDILNRLIKGCVMPTFEQLNIMTEMFQISPEKLLAGDREHYEATVVHYMYGFKNCEGREEILDIIENYAKLASAVV